MSDVQWLFLDFNCYFAACEQHERPELRGRPVIVVPVEVDTSCAIAASYEARAYGIKTGTPIGEARARCPDLVMVRARHDLYTRLHRQLAATIESCIPITAVLSIDEMHCRLMRNEQSLPAAMALARKIKETIARDVGPTLTCSIGLAPNPYLAKVAAEMKKPNGLTALTLDDLPDALFGLALRDLPGIGPRMEARLHRHGIHNLRDLTAATREDLRAVWGGVEGLRMHANLRGERVERPRGPTRSIGHQHVLEPATRQWPRARQVARQLLMRAAERLRAQGLVTACLVLVVKPLGHGPTRDRACRFAQTDDSRDLLARLDELWEPMAKGERPLRVGVVLTNLAPRTRQQLDLFAARPATPTRPLRSARLIDALDTLNRKYGRYTVGFGLSPDDSDGRHTRISFSRVPDDFEF